MDLFALQLGLRLCRASDVNEIGVCESSRLASLPVDSDSDIKHVPDLTEKVIQLLIAQLEGHVPNEQGFRRWVGLSWCFGTGTTWLTAYVVLDSDATACEVRLVQGADGFCGGFLAVELDMGETTRC